MTSDTMTVTLPKWLIDAMDGMIARGDFVDRSDVVRHALRVAWGA